MDLTRIYGIEFDEAVSQGGEKRICHAAGLQNDYVIGTAFQNGGRNDFDNAYPFGALRLCNVTLCGGEKQVTYMGQPGFSLQGNRGNVMVEIPKFYTKREKIGTVERWMVSGTRHPGFSLEPVFFRDGKELPCVYVGVYNTENRGGGLFSVTGGVPDVGKTAGEFHQEFLSAGYDPYDLAVLLCLQRLIVIEFGTRYVKQHLGGMAYLSYFSRVTPNNAIVEVGENRVTKIIPSGPKGPMRTVCFAPGQEIGMGRKENDMSLRRTITQLCVRDGLLDIYYDGEDASKQLTPKADAVFGIPQRNGKTDGLPYHTGRTDLHCLDADKDYLVNGFRYRGIENVWGNVWEHLAGLKIANLQYRYTFNPDLYGKSSDMWEKVSFSAPEQRLLAPKAENLWIDSMGCDEQESLLMLPRHSTGTADKFGTYYDSAIYAYKNRDYSGEAVDPDYEWAFSVGGGFDHAQFGSLFTYRGFMNDHESASWLYSHRVCLRK